MFYRAIGVVSLVGALIFLPLSGSRAQNPTPPSQPMTGPGGKQAAHAAVIKNRYEQGAKEYWIFEPDSPKPATAPLIIFLHGWGGTNPLYYGAWLDHLVKRGNIVVYPRYQANLLTARSDFFPNTIDAIKNAIARLQSEPGHVRPDLNKFAVVGHSLGGLLAASVTALASDSGLPRVRAVMSVEPAMTREPANIPLADLSLIPRDTLLLAVAGDRDTLARDNDAKRIYYESTRVPAGNKDFVMLVSDDHARPGLNASHRAPTSIDKSFDNGDGSLLERTNRSDAGPLRQRLNERMQEADQSRGGIAGNAPQSQTTSSGSREYPIVDAMDYYGVWKLFDGLCDAAFYGKNREFALGNTPQQRFMGVWSDGVKVKELIVTDKP